MFDHNTVVRLSVRLRTCAHLRQFSYNTGLYFFVLWTIQHILHQNISFYFFDYISYATIHLICCVMAVVRLGLGLFSHPFPPVFCKVHVLWSTPARSFNVPTSRNVYNSRSKLLEYYAGV